jgi:hypothetical protein
MVLRNPKKRLRNDFREFIVQQRATTSEPHDRGTSEEGKVTLTKEETVSDKEDITSDKEEIAFNKEATVSDAEEIAWEKRSDSVGWTRDCFRERRDCFGQGRYCLG